MPKTETPSTNGDNGLAEARDSKGRFLPGNPGGPGNPQARNVATWRKALAEAVSADDVTQVAQRLVEAAKAGEPWAVRELLDRLLGKSAGEFFTPPEVARLMAIILDPQPGQTVYDPCCGSGGLLIKTHLRLLETRGDRRNDHLVLPAKVAPLRLFGQDIGPEKYAMTRMNAVLHDMEAEVALGDTMRRPAFTDEGGRLRTFDLVVANPMWNQDEFSVSTYENDTFGRFTRGSGKEKVSLVPPKSSADWGWIQHMAASLKEGGRMAVVLDTGAVGRGSGNQGSNKERDIRRLFVQDDLIEAVLLMPENMFYNTPAPGIVMVINRRKKHKGEILLVNSSKQFSKGRPKNFLEEKHIEAMAEVYLKWKAVEGLSAVITTEEAARNDYNLSPSRYVRTDGEEEVLPLDEAVVLLREVEEERAEADGVCAAHMPPFALRRAPEPSPERGPYVKG